MQRHHVCLLLLALVIGSVGAEDEIPLVCANHTKPFQDENGHVVNGTDSCAELNCPHKYACVADFDRYYCCDKEAEEFYDDLQLCPGGLAPYSVELTSTYSKKEHFRDIWHAQSCDKLDCPDDYTCRKSKKSAKCCPSKIRPTTFAVVLKILSQPKIKVTRDYCPAGQPATDKHKKPLSCGIFFNKESPEVCPKDHTCMEFSDETSKCCPSTGPASLFASPTCAEAKTAVLSFGCGLAVGLSGLADVFANLFNPDAITTTTLAPPVNSHTNEDIPKKGWMFAGHVNTSEPESPGIPADGPFGDLSQVNSKQSGCQYTIINRQLHCMSALDGTDCPKFQVLQKAFMASTSEGCQGPAKLEEKFNAYTCLDTTLNSSKGADCFKGATEVLRRELDENFPKGPFKDFCAKLQSGFKCAESTATCKKNDVSKLFSFIRREYDDLFAPYLGSGCITGDPVKIPTIAIRSKKYPGKNSATAWLRALYS